MLVVGMQSRNVLPHTDSAAGCKETRTEREALDRTCDFSVCSEGPWQKTLRWWKEQKGCVRLQAWLAP